MHIFLYFFSKIIANTFDFFVLRQLTSTIYMAVMRSFYIRPEISIFFVKNTRLSVTPTVIGNVQRTG
jgi:hypothetical protein